MPLVIDTYSDYFFYLQYRRRCVPATIKSNKLALQYFSLLFGNMDTKRLSPIHMVRFREFLRQRKRQHRNDGEYKLLSEYSIYKIMVKLRAYITRLESERLVSDLKPIDVPIGTIPRPFPKFLTKDELKIIIDHLDLCVAEADIHNRKDDKYNAYLYRAIIRFLYTT